MTKTTIIAALTLAIMMSEASAGPRWYYDASGKLIGTETTDSSDTTPWTEWRAIYDASRKLIGSKTTDSNGTLTFYNASGRVIYREENAGASKKTMTCSVIKCW